MLLVWAFVAWIVGELSNSVSASKANPKQKEYCELQQTLCALPMTNAVQDHIRCISDGKPTSNCVDFVQVDISKYQEGILNLHNGWRTGIANGAIAHLKSAANMTPMSWDKDLAFSAQLNTLQCEMKFDDCRAEVAYPFAGQVLKSYFFSSSSSIDEWKALQETFTEWYEQNKHVTMANVRRKRAGDQDLPNAGAIDKFAIMMNYRSYKMGCAAAYYNGSGIYSPRSFLIVCNYSFIDMPNLSIWEEGPAASKCKSGPDPKYSGLCLPPDQAPKKAKPTYPMPFNNPVQKHYCALEKKYCFNYQTNAYRSHIGCESDGNPLEICEKFELVEMEPFIDLILGKHNELRATIANGWQSNYEPAARMPSLTWDWKLAKTAALNTLYCEMRHDGCRAEDEYPYAGQNLAIKWFQVELGFIDEILVELILGWFNEHRFATMEHMLICGQGPQTEGAIGHFTAMINDRSVKIGCAIATFIDRIVEKGLIAVLVSCNYSYTNMFGEPVYTSGDPASNCSHGSDPKYPGLCLGEDAASGISTRYPPGGNPTPENQKKSPIMENPVEAEIGQELDATVEVQSEPAPEGKESKPKFKWVENEKLVPENRPKNSRKTAKKLEAKFGVATKRNAPEDGSGKKRKGNSSTRRHKSSKHRSE